MSSTFFLAAILFRERLHRKWPLLASVLPAMVWALSPLAAVAYILYPALGAWFPVGVIAFYLPGGVLLLLSRSFRVYRLVTMLHEATRGRLGIWCFSGALTCAVLFDFEGTPALVALISVASYYAELLSLVGRSIVKGVVRSEDPTGAAVDFAKGQMQ